MVFVKDFRVGGFARLLALAWAFALIPASFPRASTPSGGTLTVITVPERAEVWIDEGYAGLTPIRDKRLPAGTYTLRLVDPSRQKSASETIVIGDGERLLVERSLGGSYGKLRVDTDPQGADVGIVADLGKTPLVNEYLTPGQYKLEIRHPDPRYLPITQEVSFVDGQPVTISHKMEKPPLFTTKRIVQLALGAGAAAGWTWAVVEQGATSSSRERSERLKADGRPDEANEMLDKSQNAGIRRTIAVIVAASLSAALQVTLFIW